MSDEKKFLTAAEILEKDDLPVQEIDVPEWGGTLRLRPLTAEEAISYNDTIKSGGDKRHAAVILAGLCLVNEDGAPLFSAKEVQLLAKKSLSALMKIQRVALKINGLTKDEETIVKND